MGEHPSETAGDVRGLSAAWRDACRRCDSCRRAILTLTLLALGSCAAVPERATGPAPPAPAPAAEVAPATPSPGAAGPIPLAEPGPPIPEPIIQRGTGVFINPQPAPRATVEVTDDGDAVTLNFVNADVRDVIRVVLGDVLGRNYLVSPAVGGTVTIQTSEPIPRAAVLELFEQALRLTGATIVPRDGLLEVVPRETAVQTGTGVEIGPRQRARTPGFGVEILPLEYVGAAQMLEILQSALLPETFVDSASGRNVLIVAGGSDQRRTVAELVELFDVDWLRGRSVGLFPLEFAQADAITTELRSIFASDDGEPAADVIRFTPVERLNAVLAISTQARYIDRVSEWIERLDKGIGETAPQVFVYYVQNKRAADLAEVLSQIFTAGGLEAPTRPGEIAPGRTPVSIGGDRRLGSLGLTPGSRTTGTRRLEPTAAAEQPPGEQPLERAAPSLRTRGRTVPGDAPLQPSPAPAADVAVPDERPPAAIGPPGADGDVLLPGEEEIRIIADESSNALVVLATPRDYRRVEAALRQLDITPLQVLIEATIAEVTLNDNLAYGLQWFFESGDFAARFTEVTTEAGAPVFGSIFPGFSAIFSGADARVVLNAVASVTDLNVISAPQVLVLDNQTAVLQVGDQVPVPIRQAVPIDVDLDERSVVSTIEFRDTGTILLVTPRVNASGLVTLEIEQEVSDAVETATSGIDAPTIQRRLIQTTVAVDSGETLALGGLIRDRSNRVRSGVPLLMDIPILGALFRRTADMQDRSEILVLITPRVIRHTHDARAVTQELRRRLSTLAPLEERIQAPAPLPPVVRPTPVPLPPAPAPR